ncbi:uncharacterized protein BP5553_02487 [Venustampulla echinocandica]|uniref:Uncharacterized protein n=1 Tax=Venustampulla echinocandica TaxID=2656787 RepID=A0A370U416_9HELO|nr:uncharacterized protein BP5553_02487 [Venustampulla echinocandica]RDL42508.1 hypothetical protein BP5553_02487 [Venustampulla echinocandica]
MFFCISLPVPVPDPQKANTTTLLFASTPVILTRLPRIWAFGIQHPPTLHTGLNLHTPIRPVKHLNQFRMTAFAVAVRREDKLIVCVIGPAIDHPAESSGARGAAALGDGGDECACAAGALFAGI